jgi:hypothetical protein
MTRSALEMARRLGRRSHALTLLGNLVSPAVDIGEWDAVAMELEAAREDETEEFGRNYLTWSVLPIRAWRGEEVAADMAEMARWAHSLGDTSAAEAIFGLRADVDLAQHDWQAAYDAYVRFGRSDVSNAPRSYVGAGLAALLMGDAGSARAALDLHVSTGIHGQLARADRKLMRAGIAALEGQTAASRAEFREALAGYRDLGVDWRLALTGLVMATVLGPATSEAASAIDAARAIFIRLGAKPMIEALDRALETGPSGAAPKPVTVPDTVPAQ